MNNDIVWRERTRETKRMVLRILSKLQSLLEDSRKDVGRFWTLGFEKKWYVTHTHKPDGDKIKLLKAWCSMLLRRSCIPCLQCFGKRRIKKQRIRKEIYSLQRKWCYRWIDSWHCYFCQSAQYLRSSRRLVQRINQRLSKCRKTQPQNQNLESMVVPTEFPNANTLSLRLTWMFRETCCDNTSRNSQNFLKIKIWPNYAPTLGFFKNIGKAQFFITIDEEGPDDMKTLCRKYTSPRNEAASRARGWIRGNTKIVPVLDVKLYFRQGRYCVGVWSNLYFETEQFLGFAPWMESKNT